MIDKKRSFLPLAVLYSLCCWAARGQAGEIPACEPGYRIVEEVCYKEVIHKVCRLVPDVKKVTKPVFEVKCIPYCQKKWPGSGCQDCCGKGPCPTCGKVRTRKVLMKKFVTCEEPITRCEVECVVERIPYTVYRKVPCGAIAPETIPAPK
jgi:hypothetical protein